MTWTGAGRRRCLLSAARCETEKFTSARTARALSELRSTEYFGLALRHRPITPRLHLLRFVAHFFVQGALEQLVSKLYNKSTS